MFHTLPEAFQHACRQRPDTVALRTPGDAVRLTWAQYDEAVRRIAGGLASLGVRRGDTVAVMLTNRPEFHLAATAAEHLGATSYSIYNTSAVEQITFLLTNAATRVVITERQFADKVRQAGGPVEHLLVVEDGDLDRLEPADDFDFEAAWRAVSPDDVLCLIYTSGATGDPKGVQHTHRSMLAIMEAMGSVFDTRPTDQALSYLPAANVADRVLNHYLAQASGPEVTCVAELSDLPGALAELQPTIFAAVPRVWEKLKLAVDLQLQANPQLAAGFEAGAPQVLEAVRTKLGLSRVRWALTGASAIAPDVYAFLVKLGIPVSEVWGMSEIGMASAAAPDKAKPGTVGPLLPGWEGRLAEDGELLVRGPGVMAGYRNDPVRTAEAIDAEGWLHTGDIATMDDEGYLTIVDRKKELIINAAGKNMSPSNIENAVISGSPLIGTVMVIGDNRPYNVALITLAPDAVPVFAARLGLDPDPAVLAKDERLRQAVQEGVDAGNARLSRVEQIKRFTILPVFWEPGSEELTPSMKLRRRPVLAKYAAEIESLYLEKS
ncbi:AMP-binding protein [Nonomuraea sp. NPDC050556]|uniref:AMP-binding protein n=1 Tax=Nonomuraea sp. NPDC050556 TaxID=3364369 RepID=UPI003796E788